MPRHLLNLAFLFLMVGCAPFNPRAIRLKEINLPVKEIRIAAINAVPLGHRAISPNGREILSKHFILGPGRTYRPAGDSEIRYFAQILILGDRQPYDVELLVTQEKRVLKGSHFTYKITGDDPRLAKNLEERLRTELTKRREDRNIIDDFRVF